MLQNKPEGLSIQTFNLLTRLPNEAGEVHASEDEIPEGNDSILVRA